MVEILKNTNQVNNRLIFKCLSTSGVCGFELRKAHYHLGVELAKQIVNQRNLSNSKVAVLIMMRAGLPFGMGIADSLEESNDITILFSTNENDFSTYDTVVIADAVINTGKTIAEIERQIKDKKVIIATNVISAKYLDNLKELDIFATRISDRSYEGIATKTISNGKGPDTGERLFKNTFFK